jgi:hypothetical protein
MSTLSWNEELLTQLEWHWDHQLRTRLDGMTDEEFLWEPVDGMWSVRPTGDGWALDFAYPEPSPPPVTTIAWRVNHLLLVFGVRNASHFGREPVGCEDYPYAGDPATALARLDEEHDTWVTGVRGLGEDGLLEPCGPAEGPFSEAPKAALVLHIHREVIHHGAEIALLRDLYTHRFDRKAV